MASDDLNLKVKFTVDTENLPKEIERLVTKANEKVAKSVSSASKVSKVPEPTDDRVYRGPSSARGSAVKTREYQQAQRDILEGFSGLFSSTSERNERTIRENRRKQRAEERERNVDLQRANQPYGRQQSRVPSKVIEDQFKFLQNPVGPQRYKTKPWDISDDAVDQMSGAMTDLTDDLTNNGVALRKETLGMKSRMATIGGVFENFTKRWRSGLTGVLIDLHALRIVGQSSRVVSAMFDVMSKSIGYVIDMALIPALPWIIGFAAETRKAGHWLASLNPVLKFLISRGVLLVGGSLIMLNTVKSLYTAYKGLQAWIIAEKLAHKTLALTIDTTTAAFRTLLAALAPILAILATMLIFKKVADRTKEKFGSKIDAHARKEHPGSWLSKPMPRVDFRPITAAVLGENIAYGGMSGFASGGLLKSGQAAVVGEKGPELLIPGSGGYNVVPNHGLRFLAEGTGDGILSTLLDSIGGLGDWLGTEIKNVMDGVGGFVGGIFSKSISGGGVDTGVGTTLGDSQKAIMSKGFATQNAISSSGFKNANTLLAAILAALMRGLGSALPKPEPEPEPEPEPDTSIIEDILKTVDDWWDKFSDGVNDWVNENIPLNRDDIIDIDKPLNGDDIIDTTNKKTIDDIVDISDRIGVDDLVDITNPVGIDDLVELGVPLALGDLIEIEKPLGRDDIVEIPNPLGIDDLIELPTPKSISSDSLYVIVPVTKDINEFFVVRPTDYESDELFKITPTTTSAGDMFTVFPAPKNADELYPTTPVKTDANRFYTIEKILTNALSWFAIEAKEITADFIYKLSPASKGASEFFTVTPEPKKASDFYPVNPDKRFASQLFEVLQVPIAATALFTVVAVDVFSNALFNILPVPKTASEIFPLTPTPENAGEIFPIVPSPVSGGEIFPVTPSNKEGNDLFTVIASTISASAMFTILAVAKTALELFQVIPSPKTSEELFPITPVVKTSSELFTITTVVKMATELFVIQPVTKLASELFSIASVVKNGVEFFTPQPTPTSGSQLVTPQPTPTPGSQLATPTPTPSAGGNFFSIIQTTKNASDIFSVLAQSVGWDMFFQLIPVGKTGDDFYKLTTKEVLASALFSIIGSSLVASSIFSVAASSLAGGAAFSIIPTSKNGIDFFNINGSGSELHNELVSKFPGIGSQFESTMKKAITAVNSTTGQSYNVQTLTVPASETASYVNPTSGSTSTSIPYTSTGGGSPSNPVVTQTGLDYNVYPQTSATANPSTTVSNSNPTISGSPLPASSSFQASVDGDTATVYTNVAGTPFINANGTYVQVYPTGAGNYSTSPTTTSKYGNTGEPVTISNPVVTTTPAGGYNWLAYDGGKKYGMTRTPDGDDASLVEITTEQFKNQILERANTPVYSNKSGTGTNLNAWPKSVIFPYSTSVLANKPTKKLFFLQTERIGGITTEDKVAAYPSGSNWTLNLQQQPYLNEWVDYKLWKTIANSDLSNLMGGSASERIPGLALGGSLIKSGLAWVGERGRELMALPRGAEVMPHTPSMDLLAKQTKPQVIDKSVHYHIDGNTFQVSGKDERQLFEEFMRLMERESRRVRG